MSSVAARQRRDAQILALRVVDLEQIHRSALVRYLRAHGITGPMRDATLQEFYALADLRSAAVREHEVYLRAATSHLCACELLKEAGDGRGARLLRDYERVYGQFFRMFCENARSRRAGSPYLLRTLLGKAEEAAETLRRRILAGALLPAAAVALKLRHEWLAGRRCGAPSERAWESSLDARLAPSA